MTERADLLARVRVASPCPADWEGMEGDERVRFCRLCDLKVYNLSEMTRAEAEALVARTEGRLCARLYRRADGTVLTKDCPRGLRAVRLRASRAAGAAFAALLSLFAAASGKSPQRASCPGGGGFTVEKTQGASSYSKISGAVYDPACAVVAGAEVRLANKETGRKFRARTSGEGEFLFAALPPGEYALEIDALGFRHFRGDLYVGAGQAAHLGATLDVGILGEIVIVETGAKADIESVNGGTVFRGKALTGLPHP